MLPGKKYTPEDILAVLRRRIWFLLVPFAVIGAVTAVVARKMPDSYQSTALIQVIPQRVPTSYVQPTVTTSIEDRLQTIRDRILSRTRLERIIQEFNLYEQERKTGLMEDIVQRMRNQDIRVQVNQSDAFTVSYTAPNPRTAMRVAERMASLFIDESLRDREAQADGTSQFLESQLDTTRKRLEEAERRLEEYKRAHAGELPSQLDSNLQSMQNRQMQIQSIVESLNRDADKHILLERQIAELQTPTPVAVAPTDSAAAPGTTGQQLAAARSALAALYQRRLKDDHPDVLQMKRVIRDLETKAEQEALGAPVSDQPAPQSPAETARLQRLAATKDDLALLDKQIADKQMDEERLRDEVAVYQSRAEAAPTRESEMTDMMRDYGAAASMYNSLLAKREDSKIAADLERQQIGEQFRVLDPARLPERPITSKSRITAIGLAAGLAIGLALVFLLEYRDATFRTDEDVSNLIGLPVLAVVPVMRSEVERRRQRLRDWIVGLGLGSTVTVCLAVVAYTFVR